MGDNLLYSNVIQTGKKKKELKLKLFTKDIMACGGKSKIIYKLLE